MRQVWRWLVLLVVLAPSLAAAKPRALSINVCTDQLLVDLADSEQILGVSTYATDASMSWVAARAGPFKAVAAAEAVIDNKPDVVMAGVFNKAETRAILTASGVRVETFGLTESLEEVRAQIRRAGMLLDQTARAEAVIGRLDAALARLRQAALSRSLRILPLQRRGWVSGPRTLLSEILALAGLTNIAAEIGLGHGGYVGLEKIIRLKPDLILSAREEATGEDQGSALLLHPALLERVPHERWVHIPGRLTVCAAGGLIEAIDLLAHKISDIDHSR